MVLTYLPLLRKVRKQFRQCMICFDGQATKRSHYYQITAVRSIQVMVSRRGIEWSLKLNFLVPAKFGLCSISSSVESKRQYSVMWSCGSGYYAHSNKLDNE